ncbi:MAG: hypothetical protein Q8O64_12035 [Sideroxyarcus sp.]|nr:hypothetical protein [Sideroxyarcus sp.]
MASIECPERAAIGGEQPPHHCCDPERIEHDVARQEILSKRCMTIKPVVCRD